MLGKKHSELILMWIDFRLTFLFYSPGRFYKISFRFKFSHAKNLWDRIRRLIRSNLCIQMASVFVGSGAGDKAHPHQHHLQRHHVSSKNVNNKTSCVVGDHQASGTLPKCVCAPATHAGSFKCRLHRTNSNGQSSPSAPTSDA